MPPCSHGIVSPAIPGRFIAFSVAAHLDPEVLFLDEVLAVGDFAFREKCFARLREVRTSGKTVLLVSHDMASVESLCSHAMWLHEGEVRAWGKPSDVVRKYIPPPEEEATLQAESQLST